MENKNPMNNNLLSNNNNKDMPQSKIRGKENLRGVYLLATCFFLLFTSFGGASSLMGSIFDQKKLRNLAQLQMFTLYLAFSIGVFFAKVMVSK